MKKIILVLMLMTALTGCRNDSKESVKSEPVKEANKELVVKINFKTNKKDVFKIMMNNIVVDDLQKKNIQIFEEVIPSTGFDQIIAKFGPENISKNIVINLGNKEVKEVEIVNVSASYGKNFIDIKTLQDQLKYLAFNKFIERDSISNKLKTKKVTGAHNPVIIFKHNLINLLKSE